MTPLVAYLGGFAVIQLTIASCAYGFGQKLQDRFHNYSTMLRWMGLSISAIGFVFLVKI